MTGNTPTGDFPPLETKRLILRRLTLDDTDFVFRHFSDPEMTRFLLDEDPLTDRSQAEQLIRSYLDPIGKTYNRWAIVRKSDAALIGTCGFHKWDKRHHRAEIGYDLTPDAWGRGLMAEAVREMIRHGFESMRLNRIDALVYPENARSLRLLEKLSFKKEGLLRDYYRARGEYFDHAIYSLLNNNRETR